MLAGDFCQQFEPTSHRMWSTRSFNDVMSRALTHFRGKRTIRRKPPQRTRESIDISRRNDESTSFLFNRSRHLTCALTDVQNRPRSCHDAVELTRHHDARRSFKKTGKMNVCGAKQVVDLLARLIWRLDEVRQAFRAKNSDQLILPLSASDKRKDHIRIIAKRFYAARDSPDIVTNSEVAGVHHEETIANAPRLALACNDQVRLRDLHAECRID
jgi:hypothetical protein